MAIKILAFAGSTRTDSFNKKLIRIAAKEAENQGAEVTLIDLRDYPMPLYDGDLERDSGLPENALKIRNLMCQSQGLLMSCPEYNFSVSGVWKNTIDWVSRKAPGDKTTCVAFKNEIIGLLSASPSYYGGMRSLINTRYIFTNMGLTVVPKQFSLVAAHEKFTDDDQLKNDNEYQQMSDVVTQLIDTIKRQVGTVLTN